MDGLRFGLLHGCYSEAVDKPALREQECKEEWGYDNHGAGHQRTEELPGFIVTEQQDAERRGRDFLAAHRDERPEQVVPMGYDREDAKGSQRRRGHGDHDAPDDLELAEPIEAGCVNHLVGYRPKELPQQKNAES